MEARVAIHRDSDLELIFAIYRKNEYIYIKYIVMHVIYIIIRVRYIGIIIIFVNFY